MITKVAKGLFALARNGNREVARTPIGQPEKRTTEQLRRHYEIEKELASRLRSAMRGDRRKLYASLYDELYRRVPDHPQLTRKVSAEGKARQVRRQMQFLSSFLTGDATFLEVGAGDCSLSVAVAERVHHVYAVDVSDEVTKGLAAPANFELCLSDGCSIPVPEGSVDIAYSNSLMEHLHPDDAREQLANIHRALAPSGIYICRTPNRLSGPHDVSAHFDSVATGFHLKEYTVSELRQLFMEVGFSKVKLGLATRGRYIRWSVRCAMLLERALGSMGYSAAWPAPLRRVLRPFIDIRMIGVKR